LIRSVFAHKGGSRREKKGPGWETHPDSHEGIYGLGLTPMTGKKATRTDWKIHALPRARKLLRYVRELSNDEYRGLCHGFIPEPMDEKWLFHRRRMAQFHRSWTGYCIRRVRVEPIENRWREAKVWVNRNKRQYSHSLFDDIECRTRRENKGNA
jgi:hypothetical protein